jgi:hypothetical protein
MSIDNGVRCQIFEFGLHQHTFPYEVMLATRVGEAVQKARSNGHVITITVQTQALQLCLRLNIKSEYCTSWVNDFTDCILSAVGHPTGRVSPTTVADGHTFDLSPYGNERLALKSRNQTLRGCCLNAHATSPASTQRPSNIPATSIVCYGNPPASSEARAISNTCWGSAIKSIQVAHKPVICGSPSR